MDTLLLLRVCALKFHCMICSSQSCNAQSTPSIEIFHSGLGLDPDNECKKILQLCKTIQRKSSTESNNVV